MWGKASSLRFVIPRSASYIILYSFFFPCWTEKGTSVFIFLTEKLPLLCFVGYSVCPFLLFRSLKKIHLLTEEAVSSEWTFATGVFGILSLVYFSSKRVAYDSLIYLNR